jgi:hypothetical protein
LWSFARHQERFRLSTIAVPENPNMSDHAPAYRFRFRDSTFLLAVAILALTFGALSLYMQNVDRAGSVTTTASDEGPRIPLPAGPRKYQ